MYSKNLKRKWVLHQSWREVIFLHWALPPEKIKHFIPDGLSLDLWDGRAWVSLVGFSVSNSYSRFLPRVAVMPSFCELNLRTYVTNGTRRGVVFLHIDANSLFAVGVNVLAGLPYHFARSCTCASNMFNLSYPESSSANNIDICWKTSGDEHLKDSHDAWLSERYCTFQQRGDRVYRYDIVHPEWTLFDIDVRGDLSYRWGSSISLSLENIIAAQYSPGVDACLWAPVKI